MKTRRNSNIRIEYVTTGRTEDIIGHESNEDEIVN
jgi:hypothetical protein